MSSVAFSAASGYGYGLAIQRRSWTIAGITFAAGILASAAGVR